MGTKPTDKSITGVLIALLIMVSWLAHLLYILENVTIAADNFVMYLHAALQAYLYTGLFITGHDAMHGVVSKNRAVNNAIGHIACLFYAGLSYKQLFKNHFLHHKYPGEERDPDYNVHSQNFFIWYGTFMFRYTTILQLIIMAAAFNLLALRYSEPAIIVLWMVPAFVSTFQLFYFGTYKPHMLPHTEAMQPHNARSLPLNHSLAMLSCYFFGYHHEHHESPKTPWWQLYKMKEAQAHNE